MMQVTEAHGPRFELAVERLLTGHPFNFQGVSFWLAPDGYLDVSVDSSWRVENVTEQRALEDLKQAQNVFLALSANSPPFAEVAKEHTARFILIYNYGTGSVELGRMVEARLVWAKGVVPPTE